MRKRIICLTITAGLLASPFVAMARGNTTDLNLNGGDGRVAPPGIVGNPSVIVTNPFGGGIILNPTDPPRPTGGGGDPEPNPSPGGFRPVRYSDLDLPSGGSTNFPPSGISAENTDGTILSGASSNSPYETGEGDPPTSGGDESSSINYGIVEQRPDFQFNDGQRLFQQTASSSAGQKSLGIAPAVASDGPKFIPVGEF